MVSIQLLQNIFNSVLDKKKECKKVLKSVETHLCPNFYKSVEHQLKMRFDARYRLFVLSSCEDSAIIQYRNVNYYVAYDYNTQSYKVEIYKK